jgi:hypothetical protein
LPISKCIKFGVSISFCQPSLSATIIGKEGGRNEKKLLCKISVLFGFLLRIRSFNELNFMIKNREFSQLFPRGTKLPKTDAIRDTLKVMNIDGLEQVNQHIVD